MKPVKVLIIGCGGREAALAAALADSSRIGNAVHFVGTHCNPQMEQLCTKFLLVDNLSGAIAKTSIYQMCAETKPDLCVVGPEEPLADGLVDYLTSQGFKCIGPPAAIALLESDKAWCRKFLTKYGYSHYSPKWYAPQNEAECAKVIDTFQGKYVIKPTGLCSGKGVKVSGDHLPTITDGLAYCRELGCSPFIIEEQVFGHEFSCMSLTDGRNCVHFPLAVDFKRAYEGNQGPNTGGMGAMCFKDFSRELPFEVYQEACQLNENVVEALAFEFPGQRWSGVLFGGYMWSPTKGLKLLEYNTRFGDPEVIAVLASLSQDVDLLKLFLQAVNGTLKPATIFPSHSSCVVYLCPKEYPAPTMPFEFPGSIFDNMLAEHCPDGSIRIIYGGVVSDDSSYPFLRTTSSRTCALVAIGEQAIGNLAENILPRLVLSKEISENFRWRSDIARLANERVNGEDDEWCEAWGIGGENKQVAWAGKNSVDIIRPPYAETDRDADRYAESGVNIEAANEAVASIQDLVRSTHNSGVVHIPGGFGAVFVPPPGELLVSSTDSVGSKSELIRQLYPPEVGLAMLGEDLVNHHVNDILAVGSLRPLFFLDYFAADKIEKGHLTYFIRGVVAACRRVGCALVGGETAEIPLIYRPGSKDLVGFIVGSVPPEKLLRPHQTLRAGDVCLALPSVSAHTNGFSLLNMIYREKREFFRSIDDEMLRQLVQPHKCYLDEIKKLENYQIPFKALIHITGGGLIDNPPRVLPPEGGLNVELWKNSIQEHLPEMFRWLWKNSGIAAEDFQQFFKIYNSGIGMIVVVDANQAQNVKSVLPEAFVLGRVVEGKVGTKPEVVFTE